MNWCVHAIFDLSNTGLNISELYGIIIICNFKNMNNSAWAHVWAHSNMLPKRVPRLTEWAVHKVIKAEVDYLKEHKIIRKWTKVSDYSLEEIQLIIRALCGAVYKVWPLEQLYGDASEQLEVRYNTEVSDTLRQNPYIAWLLRHKEVLNGSKETPMTASKLVWMIRKVLERMTTGAPSHTNTVIFWARIARPEPNMPYTPKQEKVAGQLAVTLLASQNGSATQDPKAVEQVAQDLLEGLKQGGVWIKRTLVQLNPNGANTDLMHWVHRALESAWGDFQQTKVSLERAFEILCEQWTQICNTPITPQELQKFHTLIRALQNSKTLADPFQFSYNYNDVLSIVPHEVSATLFWAPVYFLGMQLSNFLWKADVVPMNQPITCKLDCVYEDRETLETRVIRGLTVWCTKRVWTEGTKLSFTVVGKPMFELKNSHIMGISKHHATLL